MTSATLTRGRRSVYRAVTATDSRPVALFLYTRISNDREGRELGVTRQSDDLHAWAERDHPDAVVFDGYRDNDCSASTRSNKPRPQYDRIIRDARDAAESGKYRRVIIAAYSDSRLTRRPRENEDLLDLAERYGVAYHYLRSPLFDLNTADGREYARQAAARNAGEAERTAERILRAKQQQAADGVYSGGARPFGYRVEYDINPATGAQIKPGHLVIHEREAAAIREGVRSFLAGATLRTLARTWTAAGLLTGNSKAWTPTGVRRVLERGRNAGLSERHGELMGRGQWPAIISEDELIAVRAKLGDPSRKSHHGGYERKWLGAKLYRCGEPGCTSDMRSSGGNRGGAVRYCCRDHGHCVIDANAVDEYVRVTIAGVIDSSGPLPRAGSEDASRLDHEARVIEGKIAALDAEYDGGNGVMTLRAYSVQSRKLEEQLAALEEQRATLIVPENVLAGVDTAEDFLGESLERQRAIVDVLATVTILPGRRGRRPAGWDLTDRVQIVPK